MEILDGTYNEKIFKKGNVVKGIGGGITLLLQNPLMGKTKIRIPQDIEGLSIKNQEDRWSMAMIFLIVILALTLVGLLLAIPLMLLGKEQETLCYFTTSKGSFGAKANKSEWKMLSKYVREPTKNEIECPECAELVLGKAIKCKHCGASLPGHA